MAKTCKRAFGRDERLSITRQANGQFYVLYQTLEPQGWRQQAKAGPFPTFNRANEVFGDELFRHSIERDPFYQVRLYNW